MSLKITLDPRKSPEDIMTDLINMVNDQIPGQAHIPSGVLKFRNAKASVWDEDFDTTVQVSSAAVPADNDWMDVYYNRASITTVLNRRDPILPFDVAFATVHDMLPAINEYFDINLTVDDVVDNPVDADPLPAAITIIAKPDSLIYRGAATLTLHEANSPLFAMREVTNSDNADLAVSVQRGTTLATKGYQIAANAEAEVASGIHMQPSNQLLVPTDARYPVTFDAGEYWTYSVNLGLKSTANGSNFAELYQVSLRVGNANDQLIQTLELTKRNGQYFFANPKQDILMPVVAAGGDDVLQMQINPADYPTLFEGVFVTDARSVLGAYSFEVLARRRQGAATPLRSKIFADPPSNTHTSVQLLQDGAAEVIWDPTVGVDIPFMAQVRILNGGGLPSPLAQNVEYDVELPVGVSLKSTITDTSGITLTNTTLTVPAGLGRIAVELEGVIAVPADWAGGDEVVLTLSLDSEQVATLTWSLVE